MTAVSKRRLTDDSEVQRVADRIGFRPGYSFKVRVCGELDIESTVSIPDAARPGGTILDQWHNHGADVGTEADLFRGALADALHSAIHEVLEWFAIDGQRLVDAHNDRVDEMVSRSSKGAAAWCWRHRSRYPGHPAISTGTRAEITGNQP